VLVPGVPLSFLGHHAAFAYALSSDLQLDAGANLGLTDDSPDIELYAGLSLRF